MDLQGIMLSEKKPIPKDLTLDDFCVQIQQMFEITQVGASATKGHGRSVRDGMFSVETRTHAGDKVYRT